MGILYIHTYFCAPFQHNITSIQSNRTNGYEKFEFKKFIFSFRLVPFFAPFQNANKKLEMFFNIMGKNTKTYKSIICSHRNYRNYYYLALVYHCVISIQICDEMQTIFLLDKRRSDPTKKEVIYKFCTAMFPRAMALFKLLGLRIPHTRVCVTLNQISNGRLRSRTTSKMFELLFAVIFPFF